MVSKVIVTTVWFNDNVVHTCSGVNATMTPFHIVVIVNNNDLDNSWESEFQRCDERRVRRTWVYKLRLKCEERLKVSVTLCQNMYNTEISLLSIFTYFTDIVLNFVHCLICFYIWRFGVCYIPVVLWCFIFLQAWAVFYRLMLPVLVLQAATSFLHPLCNWSFTAIVYLESLICTYVCWSRYTSKWSIDTNVISHWWKTEFTGRHEK
jgi:hypothetical protein